MTRLPPMRDSGGGDAGVTGGQYYTAQQVANLWIAQGGDPSKAAVMVAISEAESGWNTDAVSPTADYGLWQINQVHFAEFDTDGPELLNPAVNARIAIAISGNGSNVGAWCTAYADPSQCGTLYLAQPQPGSPAGEDLDGVSVDVHGQVDAAEFPPVPVPEGMGSVADGWAVLRDYTANWDRNHAADVADLMRAVEHIRS